MSQEISENTVIVKAIENGPLHVKGPFTLSNSKGETLETDGEAFLCRCGRSGNKPFCDGSHKKVGFTG